jgi:hypothetical protein
MVNSGGDRFGLNMVSGEDKNSQVSSLAKLEHRLQIMNKMREALSENQDLRSSTYAALMLSAFKDVKTRNGTQAVKLDYVLEILSDSDKQINLLGDKSFDKYAFSCCLKCFGLFDQDTQSIFL